MSGIVKHVVTCCYSFYFNSIPNCCAESDTFSVRMHTLYDSYIYLSTDSRLLQQVLFYLGSFDCPTLVEVDVNVLAKATGVVITNGLGIAKCWWNEETKCPLSQ